MVARMFRQTRIAKKSLKVGRGEVVAIYSACQVEKRGGEQSRWRARLDDITGDEV